MPAAVTETRTAPKQDHRTLFVVPFTSAMDSKASELLVSLLHLNLCLEPKLRWPAAKPGIARLDRDSALVLLHGEMEGSWILEGRTWGDPPQKFVDSWHLQAKDVAHQIDPSETFPAWA